MEIINEETLGFEDVSLEPSALSNVFSRKDVDTSYVLSNGMKLNTPIIASPMADVCDDHVAYAMYIAGAIGCIHRFQSIEEEANMVGRVCKANADCFAAIGTTENALDRARACIEAGAKGIIIDVAFLNNRTLTICKFIRAEFPDIYLISGNVATGAGFRMGVDAGLNAIRVGIGNGQACRTSRVTGVGVGLITSLMECYEESMNYEGPNGHAAVICDGGMDVGGSFCKALAAGANMTIMGRAFAATKEGPGRTFKSPHKPLQTLSDQAVVNLYLRGDKVYKEYRGSASMESQLVYKDRQDIITSEGVGSLVEVNGSVADALARWNGALRSSMSYLGAQTLEAYRENAVFRRVASGVFNQAKARALQSYEVTV